MYERSRKNFCGSYPGRSYIILWKEQGNNMRTRAKYLYFLLGLILLLSLGSPAAAAGNLDISLSDAAGKPGETVTVSVSLANNPGFVNMSLDIDYDHSALVLTEIVDTGVLSGQMHSPSISADDSYRLIWANDTVRSDFTVNGVVVNLVFKVADNAKQGEYPVRLSVPKNGIINYSMKKVDFQLNDGTIEVTAEQSPVFSDSESSSSNSSSGSSEKVHAHSMVHILRKEATCCSEGNPEYWMCTSCNKRYADPDGSKEMSDIVIAIDPNAHSKETYLLDAVKATKKQEGYTGDTYCIDCDALLKAGKVIPALENDVSGKEEKPAQEENTAAEDSSDDSWINPFKDIYAADSYYDAIRYVYENGLFKGVSAVEFAPAVTMTRAMFVTVLGRMAGVDTRYFEGNSFTDVVSGEWYAPYVEWAAAYGIVQGYGNGIFGINDRITVEQASAILARYADYIGISTETAGTLNAFADAGDVSGWAVENMKWVVTSGIYTGESGRLNPKTPASRALVAEMLYNFQRKNG